MQEKIIEVLTQLANKLGTTIDHLWGVLIRQANIEYKVGLYWRIGMWAVAALSFLFAIFMFIRGAAESDEDYFVYGIFTVIISLVFAAVTACGMGAWIAAKNNAEYWALQHVISMLGQ